MNMTLFRESAADRPSHVSGKLRVRCPLQSHIATIFFLGAWRLMTNERIIRLIIVEDHRLGRESLGLALAPETFIEIVAEAVHNGELPYLV